VDRALGAVAEVAGRLGEALSVVRGLDADVRAGDLDAEELSRVPSLLASMNAAQVAGFADAVGVLGRLVVGLEQVVLREVVMRPGGANLPSLVKELGYSRASVFAEQVFGYRPGQGRDVVKLVEATAPERGLSAGLLPARFALLAQALDAGELTVEQALPLVRCLPGSCRGVDAEVLGVAEASLVGAATAGVVGVPLIDAEGNEALKAVLGADAPALEGDPRVVWPVPTGSISGTGAAGSMAGVRCRPVVVEDLAKTWAAVLDPDGAEPAAEAQRRRRSLRFVHLASEGMWRLTVLAPELEAAELKSLLDALTPPPSATSKQDQDRDQASRARAERASSDGQVPLGDASADALLGLEPGPVVVDEEARSPEQARFDAFFEVVRHHARSPLAPSVHQASPTVLVTMTLDALQAAAAGDGAEGEPDSRVQRGSPPHRTTPGGTLARPVPKFFEDPPPSGSTWRKAPPPGPASPGSHPALPLVPAPLLSPWSGEGGEAWGPPSLGSGWQDLSEERRLREQEWDEFMRTTPSGHAGAWGTSATEDPWKRFDDGERGEDNIAMRPGTERGSVLASEAAVGEQVAGQAPTSEAGSSSDATVPEPLASPSVPGEVSAAMPVGDPAVVLRRDRAWLPVTNAFVPVSTVARFVCDGALQFLVSDEDGVPLRLGHRMRSFTQHQRRVLIARDGHCRAPGCTMPAGYCEAHHLLPWSVGGPTDVDNAVLLCSFHHHLAHTRH